MVVLDPSQLRAEENPALSRVYHNLGSGPEAARNCEITAISNAVQTGYN